MSSNFLIDYSYLGAGGNIAGTVVMLVLSIAAVGFRFWGRKRAKLPLKSDDWLILISLVSLHTNNFDLISVFTIQ